MLPHPSTIDALDAGRRTDLFALVQQERLHAKAGYPSTRTAFPALVRRLLAGIAAAPPEIGLKDMPVVKLSRPVRHA